MSYRELFRELCEIRQLCDQKNWDAVTHRIYALLDNLGDIH